MAGLHGNNVAHEALSAEHEVTDNIENLVAGELLRVAEGFLAHDGVTLDHDGVLQAAALDKTFLKEGFDVLVENEGAGVGDFLLVGLGIDLRGVKLGHAAAGADLGAGHAEGLVRHDGDNRAALGFKVNGLANFEDGGVGVLFFDTGFLDAVDERAGGAVSDRWLVSVHFNNGVVDSHADEGGNDVLNGVHFDGTLGQRRGAFDGLHLGNVSVDEGLIVQVNAAEFDAVIDRSGLQRQLDLLSGVERSASDSG